MLLNRRMEPAGRKQAAQPLNLAMETPSTHFNVATLMIGVGAVAAFSAVVFVIATPKDPPSIAEVQPGIVLEALAKAELAHLAASGMIDADTDASGLADSADVEVGQLEQPLPDSKATDVEPGAVVTAPRAIDDSRSETAEVDRPHADESVATTRTRSDEDAVRKRIRESATRDIRESYALLFDDLGLPPEEQDELFAFLVETQIAGTWTPYQVGKTMDPDERSSRIAAIIGYTRLQQFLALERNVASYAEAGRIESMLVRKGVPITEAQRDGLFEILVGTRHDLTIPPDVESGSIESLEYRVAQLDERERHVVELAPSVLLPQQVVYLHARYQDCSYRRADFLDRLSRDRAKDPDGKPFLAYPVCMP